MGVDIDLGTELVLVVDSFVDLSIALEPEVQGYFGHFISKHVKSRTCHVNYARRRYQGKFH